MYIYLFVFFFFKQKTAYEMRISDWSSDVCSSDLLNESLALHYGIKDVKGDRFRKVSLDDHPERWGLLGKGGVLMASSYPNRTSPVLRGEWIMDRIMGNPPEAPPPNVVTDLKENPAGRSEEHTSELQSIMRISYAG